MVQCSTFNLQRVRASPKSNIQGPTEIGSMFNVQPSTWENRSALNDLFRHSGRRPGIHFKSALAKSAKGRSSQRKESGYPPLTSPDLSCKDRDFSEIITLRPLRPGSKPAFIQYIEFSTVQVREGVPSPSFASFVPLRSLREPILPLYQKPAIYPMHPC